MENLGAIKFEDFEVEFPRDELFSCSDLFPISDYRSLDIKPKEFLKFTFKDIMSLHKGTNVNIDHMKLSSSVVWDAIESILDKYADEDVQKIMYLYPPYIGQEGSRAKDSLESILLQGGQHETDGMFLVNFPVEGYNSGYIKSREDLDYSSGEICTLYSVLVLWTINKANNGVRVYVRVSDSHFLRIGSKNIFPFEKIKRYEYAHVYLHRVRHM